MPQARAKEVWFDADNLWIALMDGRQLSVPLAYFPRLLNATQKQRQDVRILGGGIGLHWPKVDEDIDVSGLLLGNCRDTTNTARRTRQKSPRSFSISKGPASVRKGSRSKVSTADNK